MLNGDAHHSTEVEGELRIRPLLNFQRLERGGKITQFKLRRRPSNAGEGGRRGRGLARGLEGASESAPASSLTGHAMRLTILYAEDSKLVADAVSGLLELKGYTVEVCLNGDAAMNKMAGGFPYDLLLFDNELPGASGIELTRYARRLPSYQRTPIIMLSATDCSADARRAGADLFLRKPEDIAGLVDAVRRLTE
jgi:CheY-like chemotaxis protein